MGYWTKDEKRQALKDLKTNKPSYNELLASHERLRVALKALWNEVRWSGNDASTNDGWPNAIKLTREALKLIPKDQKGA